MAGLYAVVVVAHVVAVLGGLVSVGVAGGYCGAVVGGVRGAAVERYFAGGPSWGPRLLYPAALLGLAAVAASRGRVHLQDDWVLGAGGIWIGAVAVVEAVVRPAERAVAEILTDRSGASPGPAAGAGTRRSAARGLVGSAVVVAGIVAASVLMTVQ